MSPYPATEKLADCVLIAPIVKLPEPEAEAAKSSPSTRSTDRFPDPATEAPRRAGIVTMILIARPLSPPQETLLPRRPTLSVSPSRTLRSAERRVGKECVSPGRSRWSPYH